MKKYFSSFLYSYIHFKPFIYLLYWLLNGINVFLHIKLQLINYFYNLRKAAE